MKYNIGDKVFYATFSRHSTEKVTCPDCCGKKYLTIIMGDDTKIDIPCQCCIHRDEYGYKDYPRGFIEVYVSKPEVKQLSIAGINCQKDDAEYNLRTGSDSYYAAKENQLFTNEQEAIIEGQRLADEHLAEQKNNIEKRKHNDKRTWAWNVTYHRKQIEQAKRDLEYHTKKLYFAELNKKAGKNVPTNKRNP